MAWTSASTAVEFGHMGICTAAANVAAGSAIRITGGQMTDRATVRRKIGGCDEHQLQSGSRRRKGTDG